MKQYLHLVWKRYLLMMLVSSAIVAMAVLVDTNPPPVTKLLSGATNYAGPPMEPVKLTVRWQFDPVRYNNWLVEQDELFAEKFYKTNTTAARVVHSRYHQPIRVTTNDVELGYVSNGAVVWRVPPEAKP